DCPLAAPGGGETEGGGHGRLADAALAGHEDRAFVEDRSHECEEWGPPERTGRCGKRGRGRNRPSGCEYPCAMGLLQRFARPEYRPGAPESPPETERHDEAPAPAGNDNG